MAFHDLSFLFLIFPLALAVYLPVPKVLRHLVLLAVSLLFFAWGSPEYVLLLVLVIAFNYLSALQIQGQNHPKDRKRTRSPPWRRIFCCWASSNTGASCWAM